MRTIPPSELLVNDDGSVYHLHLRPEDLADTVILVGDPGRVAMVAAHFDTRDKEVSNREFHTITGTCKGKRLTVISTGIGTDNIDIVILRLCLRDLCTALAAESRGLFNLCTAFRTVDKSF